MLTTHELHRKRKVFFFGLSAVYTSVQLMDNIDNFHFQEMHYNEQSKRLYSYN